MACGDPGSAKCAETQTASTAGVRVRVMTLSESFLEPLVAGDQKVSLASLFSVAPPVQARRGLPGLGSLSVVWCLRHIDGLPGWGPPL